MPCVVATVAQRGFYAPEPKIKLKLSSAGDTIME
jgi:hypothetical protein